MSPLSAVDLLARVRAGGRQLLAQLRGIEARIELAPQRVALRVYRRGRPLGEARERTLSDTPAGQPSWHAALAALDQVLADVPAAAPVTVVLSNHFVRYACLPWRELDEDERQVFARHRLVELYGASLGDAVVVLDDAGYGKASIVAAVEATLLSALRAQVFTTGATLRSVQPQFVTAFNRHRPALAGERAWFVVGEPGCLCAGLLRHGDWLALVTRRTGEAWWNELALLLTRAQYTTDGESDAPLYLCAPQLTGADLLVGEWSAAGLTLPAFSSAALPTPAPAERVA